MASETRPDGFSLNKPLPPELHPNIDHIVTEDDTPVDNIYSEKQQRLLTESLHSSWRREGAAPFVAFANVGLFYKLHGTPFVPDMMLSLDVQLPEDIWKKQHRSYFVWEYGKPPDVVIEVVSNREGGEDDEKLKGYAQIGVKYYVIHDPEMQLSNAMVKSYSLDGSTYRAMDEPFYFAGIGLGLRLWEGTYEDREESWLRWYDHQGELVPTGAERASVSKQQAEIAEQRAESAEQRAESAVQRAESAAQRAVRLAEQLRQLGIEPES